MKKLSSYSVLMLISLVLIPFASYAGEKMGTPVIHSGDFEKRKYGHGDDQGYL